MSAEIFADMFQATADVSLILGIFGGMIGALIYEGLGIIRNAIIHRKQ